MIEKIEILQHGEGRYLVRHLREEARRFLGIVAYHHEMVIQLRKYCLNSLPKTFLGPGGRCQVLLVQPVRHIQGDVCSIKHAEQLGKNPATVFKWCTNSTLPNLENLMDIARYLEVNVNKLLRM